jgi:hypothetical protein
MIQDYASIIPGAPGRSMCLVAIIGSGPMQGELAQEDVGLLKDWVTAGALIPKAAPSAPGTFPGCCAARRACGVMRC